MPLDIHVVYPGKKRDDFPPRLQLDDDGSFWFLYPFFQKVSQTTGQTIDLYGDASFGGDQLGALTAALAEANRELQQRPERWVFREAVDEKRGVNVKEYAVRADVVATLKRLVRLVDEANAGLAQLEFVGD
jgi:hypothetical protein